MVQIRIFVIMRNLHCWFLALFWLGWPKWPSESWGRKMGLKLPRRDPEGSAGKMASSSKRWKTDERPTLVRWCGLAFKYDSLSWQEPLCIAGVCKPGGIQKSRTASGGCKSGRLYSGRTGNQERHMTTIIKVLNQKANWSWLLLSLFRNFQYPHLPLVKCTPNTL